MNLWFDAGMKAEEADTQVHALRSYLEDLNNSIVVARTLLERGHAVDLAGFDDLVGLLCAKALDLPPDQGRVVRSDLIGLAAAVDALSAALGPGLPRA
jgi:hypothetical protein